MYCMKDNNKLNYTYDENGIINNMVSDNDGNLNVIASVINNVNNKNFDNRVTNIKDIPRQFNIVGVKSKTDDVIKRVNSYYPSEYRQPGNLRVRHAEQCQERSAEQCGQSGCLL